MTIGAYSLALSSMPYPIAFPNVALAATSFKKESNRLTIPGSSGVYSVQMDVWWHNLDSEVATISTWNIVLGR